MSDQDIETRAIEALERLAESAPDAWEGLTSEYAATQWVGFALSAIATIVLGLVSRWLISQSRNESLSGADRDWCVGLVCIVFLPMAATAIYASESLMSAVAPNFSLLRELLAR